MDYATIREEATRSLRTNASYARNRRKRSGIPEVQGEALKSAGIWLLPEGAHGWLGRRGGGGICTATRYMAPTWMLAFCDKPRAWATGHFFYRGGEPWRAQRLGGIAQQRFPAMEV